MKKSKIRFFISFLIAKIHKQVGKLERTLFFQLSETQFTGLHRRQPPPEIAAKWHCVPLIKNMTAHYNSQFCVSFHYCFHWEAKVWNIPGWDELGLKTYHPNSILTFCHPKPQPRPVFVDISSYSYLK